MIPCRRAIRCAVRIEDMSSEPRRTASTTLTAATMNAARSAQPKLSTLKTPSVTFSSAAIWRITASAIRTSRKPRTSVSGNRNAASTGGMTAFSNATTAATTSAPQKLPMSTPGRTHEATIKATPVANHDTTSGNTFRLGRSGCQAVDWPYSGCGSLGVMVSSSWAAEESSSAASSLSRRWNRSIRR